MRTPADRPRALARGAETRAAAVLATVLFAAAAGCGYTVGYGPPPEGVRTVAIAVVANDTFRQRFEIPLTRQLQEALAIHTGLRVSSFAHADAILEVRVEGIASDPLVAGRPLPVTEGALTFAVRAVLRDRQSGRVLREALVSDRAEFRTTIGEDEMSARAEAASDLARKIALALEAAF